MAAGAGSVGNNQDGTRTSIELQPKSVQRGATGEDRLRPSPQADRYQAGLLIKLAPMRRDDRGIGSCQRVRRA